MIGVKKHVDKLQKIELGDFAPDVVRSIDPSAIKVLRCTAKSKIEKVVKILLKTAQSHIEKITCYAAKNKVVVYYLKHA